MLEREILELVPPDRNVSIEREVWPSLIGAGLYGFPAEAYWLDIGTPERYLQGTFDILEGNVDTAVRERLGESWLAVDANAEIHGRVIPPAVIERGVSVAEGAHAGSLVVLGHDVSIGAGSTVERAVIMNGAEIGAGCTLRDCIVAGRLPRWRGHANNRRSGARRGGDRGGRQRDCPRCAYLPGSELARWSTEILMSTRETTESVGGLSRAAIAEVDASGQLGDVLALPEHLRDALWRVESAIMQDWDTSAGLVVAGMGGSAIGGALARAALGDHASRPIFVTRAYGLPPWTTPDTMVLCASYSGNTEETLACYESAGALGARRTVVSTGGRLVEMAREDGVPVIPLPGGFQPRAAVAYMTVAALEVAALCGAGPRLTSEIDVAAAHTEQLVAEWGPDAPEDSLAKTLARGLHGTIPVVAGAGLTAPIAYRWKTQINENAKQPCFSHELPELDHNELVGWEGAPELGRFAAVFLDDSDAHPRVKERMALTERLIASNAGASFHLETRGETTIERVISLVLLGDLVSIYLATLRGVDPGPVQLIDQLKAELAAG